MTLSPNRRRTTEEWEATLGAQLRRARLADDVDQRTLAERANVSLGALRNLESGRGSTLRTLVRVVRALDRTDWLEALEPETGASPVELFRDLQRAEQPSRPRRASRR